MSFPKIDNKAPAFALLNQNGDKVKLSDFAGRNVVLYFYPKAMTPGCTTQACGMRDAAADLAAVNAVALGVSPDSHTRLHKFAEKYQLNFDLLADESLEVTQKYGAWGPKKFMGKEYEGVLRTTFIIGVDGRLKHVIDKVKTKSHHDDVLALLKDMQ